MRKLSLQNIKLILWQFQKSYRQNFTPNHYQHFCFIFSNKVYNDTQQNDEKGRNIVLIYLYYIKHIYIVVILNCFKLFYYIIWDTILYI